MNKIVRILIVSILAVVINGVEAKANTPFIPINKWNIYLTVEEAELLSRTVQLEAGGEPVTSKIATTETILNRVSSDKFPNTLIGVLSQKGQFSVWKNITSKRATPTYNTYVVVCAVLSGQTNVLPLDSYYFNNKPIGAYPIKIGNQYYSK